MINNLGNCFFKTSNLYLFKKRKVIPNFLIPKFINKKVIVDKEYVKSLLGKNFQVNNIPRSDVFYIREKYYLDTGHWVSLDRMARAMFLEKKLDSRDVLDPKRKREWEDDYGI